MEEERVMMNEKEIVGLLLGDRIQSILKKNAEKAFAYEKPEWTVLQEELNEEQLVLVEDYLHALVSKQSEHDKHVYLEGVRDGIALLNWIRNVCEEA